MEQLHRIYEWYRSLLYITFLSGMKVPFLRNYLNKRRYIAGILNPSDTYDIIVSAMILTVKKFLLTLLFLWFMIQVGGVSIRQLPVMTGILLLLQNHLIYIMTENRQLKLLRLLEDCLNDIRHAYHNCGDVEDGLHQSIEAIDESIGLHLQIMLKMLEEDHDVEQYREIAPNRFFVTFYALCKAAVEYGDSEEGEGSVFLMNLNYLKKEITIELLKREKLNYIFSGSFFVMVLPICFLRPVELWGIGNIPELKEFYFGSSGFLVRIFLYGITILVYMLLEGLKEGDLPLQKEHWILDRILQWLPVVIILQKWKERMERHCMETSDTLRKLKPDMSLDQFLVERLLLMAGAALGGIYIVQGAKSGILGILLIPLGIWLMGLFPYFILAFQSLFLGNAMEEEIVQLQTIVLMLARIEQMDVETILQWLERFSVIFRPSIACCVDEFPYQEEKALERLKEKEGFQPLGRIVEDLQACDLVGVGCAFEDIINQQVYFMDKRRQDNEIGLSKREAVVRITAFVPMVCTIGFYLIMPFLYESFRTLLYYMEEMQGF